MTLIKSISGIRGTIGGKPGENLTPADVVDCCAAFASWMLDQEKGNTVVIGRDARMSGPLINDLAVATFKAMGMDVINLGLSTTPTVEMAVTMEAAAGGVILTASHNPKAWNALKFLNSRGEFISAETGATILDIIKRQSFTFADIDHLGTEVHRVDYINKHIEAVLELPLVEADRIREKKYRVVVDCVNSTGSISLRPLLEQLGCEVTLLYDDLTGNFSHNPEPLPQHLTELAANMEQGQYDVGIAVDPDVDRLMLMCEDGTAFGEEYTIVALADYILQHTPGTTVSNLSSTQALREVTEKHGCEYHASAVGEVNVVAKMKAVDAVFGGEGNGGVIYPELHYGRDALVGVALFLSHLAVSNETVSGIRKRYPDYVISKQKVALTEHLDPEKVIEKLGELHKDKQQDHQDGLKILMGNEWVHMRKSNTEPIIRIYAESHDKAAADSLASRFVEEIKRLTATTIH